ncbi:hypothetical protein ATO12_13240 [Aquimarina atlantica]|uniref:Tail specific protease domain-containing protein n=1 Tax=Aquimarina atlantica TaxID=1317122 RepID=A0A023BUY6_9FLAO|nr:S41 family peptidase [Aquimarina atlantica]EZH73847.1 hypothetical protein ATO12_13240 [Aquimarina atlantica]
MKLIIKSIFFLSIVISVNAQDIDKSFLTSEQVSELYKQMISEIEFLDAEAIVVRNKTKDISWDQYKKYHEKQFKKVDNYQELRQKFLDFGRGFVSGHSYFRFTYPTEKTKKNRYKSSIKIGYTYPNISFFDLETKKTIQKIDDVSMKDVFKKFVNYETRSNGLGTSQASFKFRFENGLKINGKIPKSITYSDGSSKKIVYHKNEDKASWYNRYKAIDVSGYKDWKLVKKGYKAALLVKNKIALVKIKNFAYKRGSNDLRCTLEAKDSTICSDIQKLRQGLQLIKDEVDHIVFDVQDNPGGKENSSFMAELCSSQFMDLRVQYKKTGLLLNENLRLELSYGFSGAEKWFENILKNKIYEKTKTGDFLPARADFCRGSENCDLAYIQPNKTAKRKFKNVIVLVNENTASSADDFAYRMKEYGNALIVGQPQSADLTFALVTVVFYIDDNGSIKKTYIGNDQREYKIAGQEIFQFSIPYSRTVNKQGEMLQGNPAKLDLLVELNKENFENRELYVLNNAIKKFINNN